LGASSKRRREKDLKKNKELRKEKEVRQGGVGRNKLWTETYPENGKKGVKEYKKERMSKEDS